MAITPEKNSASTNAEQARINDLHAGRAKWRDFGPYLSDRQWGTVREDYSADGSAWTFSLMTKRVVEPIAGEKMASLVSVIKTIALSFFGAMEWTGSNSQRAILRPDK